MKKQSKAPSNGIKHFNYTPEIQSRTRLPAEGASTADCGHQEDVCNNTENAETRQQEGRSSHLLRALEIHSMSDSDVGQVLLPPTWDCRHQGLGVGVKHHS